MKIDIGSLIRSDVCGQFPSRPRDLASYLVERISESATALRAMANNDSGFWPRQIDKMRQVLGPVDGPPAKELKRVDVASDVDPDVRISRCTLQFDSGEQTTVDLYSPQVTARSGSVRGVLHVPGHWMENGRLEPQIQTSAAMMAKAGLLTAVCDPQDQGSRFRGWNPHSRARRILMGESQIGSMLREYSSIIGWLIEDCGIDEHSLGVTGASGGALASIMLALVDPRVSAIGPVCYVVQMEDLVRRLAGTNWNDGLDLCNQVPQLADISTVPGLLCMRTGVHVCAVSAEADAQFPVVSALNAYTEIERWRQERGEDAQFESYVVPGPHGYSDAASVLVTRFFLRCLGSDGRDCTPSPIIECTAAAAAQEPFVSIDYIGASASNRHIRLIPDNVKDAPDGAHAHLKSGADPSAYSYQAEECSQGAIGPEELEVFFNLYDPLPGTGYIEREWQFEGRSIQRVILTPDEGLSIPLWLSVPNGVGTAPMAVVVGAGGMRGLTRLSAFGRLWQSDLALAVVELRGHAETAGVDFEVGTTALMLRRNLFAQRVADIRASVDYLSQKAALSRQLRHWAIGLVSVDVECAFYTAVAAATDVRIAKLAFMEEPVDWDELSDHPVSYGLLIPNVTSTTSLHSIVASRPDVDARVVGLDSLPLSPYQRTSDEDLCAWLESIER